MKTITILYACVLVCGSHFTAVKAQILLTKSNILKKYFVGGECNRLQLKVANQFKMTGSAADCGYHSVANGFAISQLLLSESNEERLNLFQRLRDRNMKQKLFANIDSPWKQWIAAKRADGMASKQIQAYLKKSLRISGNPAFDKLDQKSKDQLLNGITNVGSKYPRHIRIQTCTNCFTYKISSPHILSYFKKQLEDLCEDIRIEMALEEKEEHRINKKEKANICEILAQTLDSYFDFTDEEISIQISENAWLTPEEVVALAEAEEPRLPANFKVRNSDSIITYTFSPGDNYQENGEFAHLRKKLMVSGNHLAIVLLYEPGSSAPSTTSEACEGGILNRIYSYFRPKSSIAQTEAEIYAAGVQNNTNGHWITLVVNKVDKDIEFILANSGSNASRIYDRRVNELIRFLEGDKPSEMPHGISTRKASKPPIRKDASHKNTPESRFASTNKHSSFSLLAPLFSLASWITAPLASLSVRSYKNYPRGWMIGNAVSGTIVVGLIFYLISARSKKSNPKNDLQKKSDQRTGSNGIKSTNSKSVGSSTSDSKEKDNVEHTCENQNEPTNGEEPKKP